MITVPSNTKMSGFAALNEETSSRLTALDNSKTEHDDDAKDVEEEEEEEEEDEETLQEEAHYLYNAGLRKYGNKSHSEAATSFRRALNSGLLRSKKYGKTQLALKLKFNALKYLGYILADELGQNNEATDRLLEASKIDSGDTNLHYKLGVSAVKSKPMRLLVARLALERALILSRDHWPAMKLLVSVTFKQGDLITCLALIENALKREPRFQKGIVLANAIIDHEPAFRQLCPSVVVDKRVILGKNIKVYPGGDPQLSEGRPSKKSSGLGAVERSVKLQCTDWESFLCKLLEDYKSIEYSVPPTSVVLQYDEPPPAILPPSEPSVEVSVQNVVQEMVDIVSESCIANRLAEEFVSDLIDNVVFGSSKTVVSSILDSVVATAVETACNNAANSSNGKRSSNRSFIQEVPNDLLEKRRSSRVRGGYSDVATADRIEEATAQSLLESFIPPSLVDSLTNDNSNASTRLSKRAKSTSKESKGDVKEEDTFPESDKQLEDVKGFMEVTRSSSYTFEDVFFLALQRLLKLNKYSWTKELKLAYLKCYAIWRRGFCLPSEFGKLEHLSLYFDTMMVAGEIWAEATREEWLEDKEKILESLNDDLWHLRMVCPRLNEHEQMRVFLLHYTIYKNAEEVVYAYLDQVGKLLLKFAYIFRLTRP